jgi:hypothetical protein
MARVSIIVPCHNGERFIAETLSSVLGQTLEPAEVIVIDDSSTDRSLEVVGRFGGRVTTRPSRGRGACAARNTGLHVATGDLIMFMDADDLLSPSALEGLVSALNEDARADIAFCHWDYLVFERGSWRVQPQRPRAHCSDDPLRDWLEDTWWVPPCCILWRRSALDTAGHWDEAIARNQDGDLMMRALVRGCKLTPSSGGRACYRRHPGGGSVSTLRSKQALESQLRVVEKIASELGASGRVPAYAQSLARAYFLVARCGCGVDPVMVRTALARAAALSPCSGIHGSPLHVLVTRLVGLEAKEWLAARAGPLKKLVRFGAGTLWTPAARGRERQLHQ